MAADQDQGRCEAQHGHRGGARDAGLALQLHARGGRVGQTDAAPDRPREGPAVRPRLPGAALYELVVPAGLVGQRVVASGLRSRPDLNSKAGRVQKLDVAGGRYSVLYKAHVRFQVVIN